MTVSPSVANKMGDTGEMGAPKMSFQSKDLENLLNIIDQMRSQGVGRHVDIPQIIVCGDQSSGKSSCLEAICGIRFPVADSLCTRFASEFILRRSATEEITIKIIPDVDRKDKEKLALENFTAPTSDLNEFPNIVNAAAKLMGIDENSKTFSNDVLRVEISGPTQPQLTLVDLPGVFHAANARQTEQDREAVEALVTSYMKKSRSIILAVVSAKNDLNNQVVTKLTRTIDPDGRRTLGIITKPDTLHAGSNSEKDFYALAQNKDVKFALGWAIVKNRDFDTRHTTNAERDEAEKEFFSKGIWASLPKVQVGIASLRTRLSRVLRNQIIAELPGLIADVEEGITDCNSRLELLGVPRGTIKDQRSYLHRVGEEFSALVNNAVNGSYADDFFGDPTTADGYEKRLRAVVQNLLEQYAEEMRLKGEKWSVIEEETEVVKARREKRDKKVIKVPQPILRSAYLENVSEMIKRGRGRELRGTYRPEIIGDLFKDQCSPWKRLTTSSADEIFAAARSALTMALDACSDQTTNEGILRFVINPAFEKIQEDFDEKVVDLLRQHSHGHPITFNHYFTDNIQKLRNEHKSKHIAKKLKEFFGRDPLDDSNYMHDHSFSTKQLLEALTNDTEADMDKFACSEAQYFMAAYYKVSISAFSPGTFKTEFDRLLSSKWWTTSLFTPLRSAS